jgi:hypothetical protein
MHNNYPIFPNSYGKTTKGNKVLYSHSNIDDPVLKEEGLAIQPNGMIL